jgi:hypothetical protein
VRFTYTYRSSDGQRHTAEIKAESRDAAFAKVRSELGIKPIKVVAAEEPTPQVTPKRVPSRVLLAVVGAVFVAVGVVVWFLVRGGGQSGAHPETITVNTPHGPMTLSVAAQLPRQAIPGDRQRIEKALESFKHPAERLLARFAEPGRAVVAMEGERPTQAEFAACLRDPVRIASTDFTEVVDLKRIVTGMKREMAAYIAGGGTADQYIAELEKRQRLEISYRENAEKRLGELLKKPKDAYAYWLKANAQLQAMGIYPLALPDALRSYQMSFDIDE